MKKVMNEQISFPGTESVKVKMNDITQFTFPWHAHNEYEIVYILESIGTRYIGDSFDKFKKGDLVLIGSGLPHFYKTDTTYLQENPSKSVKAVVVQFPAAVVSGWGNIPEMKTIIYLLQRSARGLIFNLPEKAPIKQTLRSLHKKNGLDRLLSTVAILQQLANTKFDYASGSQYSAEMFLEKDTRLIKILDYLNRNYLKALKLKQVSELFGMNTTAFCRYFKTKTSKTFIEYIQELRIGYACQLLTQHEISIKEVAFESGFNHLSYFNRAFKRIKGITPSAYIQQISGRQTKATATPIHLSEAYQSSPQ